MNQPDKNQGLVASHIRETLLRGDLGEPGHLSGPIVQSAVHRAVSRIRSTGHGSVRLALEAAEGAVLAVVGVAGETRAFVGATVVGVVEATSQLFNITAFELKAVVVGAVRGASKANADPVETSRVAVEQAIVSAPAAGIDLPEAVAATVEGAAEAVEEAGGGAEDVARGAFGGVISGVRTAGGDVAGAAHDTASILVSRAAAIGRRGAEIVKVAENAVTAAVHETSGDSEDQANTIAAAATGAVVAGYWIDRAHGDSVRRSVLKTIVESHQAAPPHLRAGLSGVAEQLSSELPMKQKAWRGAALYRAARLSLNVGILDLAGSLAYFTVLSFFPLVTLLILGLSIFADPVVVGQKLSAAITYYFPSSGELFHEAISNLLTGSLTVGLIALAGMILCANGLFMASIRAVNRMFEVDSGRTVKRLFQEAGVGSIVVALFILLAGLTAVFHFAISFDLVPNNWALLFGTISELLQFVFTAVVFAVVYHNIPNKHVEWKDAAFGAVIAVLLFEIAKNLFFWYSSIASFRSSIYGPVASVVILLTWAYIAGLIFLYGAALTRTAGELRPRFQPAGRRWPTQ